MVKCGWTGLLASVMVLFGLLATAPADAALRAYVDRNPVAADESFTLTLESGDSLDGTPDLSPLLQDFTVVDQTKSSSFQMVNGSVSRKVQWQITLMAKHGGRITIPPMRVGSEVSAPVVVNVQGSFAPPAAQEGPLFLDVKAEPASVYVQQQIIYTVRLYRAVDIGNDATLSEPALPAGEAVIEKLGKDRSFQTVRNGMSYDVIERRYALYPQKSGTFTIPPLVFEGDVVQGGGSGGFFGFDPFGANLRHRRLRSQPVEITATPAPAAFQGSQWLPARRLDLVEHWSQSPPVFTVGQPITRTLSIVAEGLTASQLPSLAGGAINGLKQYPDQPVLKDTRDGKGITGERTESIALIPTQPGRITLPEITIPWWNTATNTQETVRLPARTIDIAPAPGGNGAAPAPAPAPMTVPPGSRSTVAPVPASASSPATRTVPAGMWPWIALLLGTGWLVTAGAWVWRERRAAGARAREKSREDSSLRAIERAIHASCVDDDPAEAKRHLLAWARFRWPDDYPVSLTALAQRCPRPLAEALRELDRALYAPAAAPWDGQEFWERFKHRRSAGRERQPVKKGGLEPLY